MANDSIRGRQNVLRLTNKSGGGLVEGDVVIISSGTAAAVTTTTTAGLNTDVIGVALETIASDATGRICITGYVPKINLSGAASLGDTFATHTVAKQAAPSATRGVGSFGEVLGTGSTPAALLWGLPDPSGAGGVASDAIWDAAGDIVQGTGANAGARLAIGTANQILRVNAGATALEYVSAGRVLISQLTPTGTGASFTTIPAGYWMLQVEGVARGDDAGAGDYVAANITLNADTTATNYRRLKHNSYATNSQNVETADDRSCLLVINASTTAGTASQVLFEIVNYAGTTFRKCVTGRWMARTETTDHIIATYFALHWENTAAVTQIDIDLAAGNFVAGTTWRLYGVY